MTLTPTPEQQDIINAAVGTTDSIIINALAGAAKTTTLDMICRAIQGVPILSLAFNKRIAEEMTKRLPSHVKSATVNSIGHRVWAAAQGKRLVLDKDKTYNTVKGIVDALPRAQRSEAYEFGLGEIIKLVKMAKINGYVPDGKFPTAKRLITSEVFYEQLYEEADGSGELIRGIVEQALTASIIAAFAGGIDFDDQIYMPTLFGGSFPQFPLVLVDEAQDLSPLNHAMLQRLVTRRLIAVGDPWQSIYAFRGADVYSMARLRDQFNMREMGLSISFRCPIEVVKRARFRAPHMQWPEWAKPGLVETLETWNASSIPDNAAIICRNNGPLFKCAMALIRAGRGVNLVGTDLGPSLVRALKKLGPEHLKQEESLAAIKIWEAERLRKSKRKAAIHDKADCLRVFVSFGETLGAAIAYAEHLFAARGPIQLLSGHKAKGLEWDAVYHLDPHLIPSMFAETDEEISQELNVRYVIETRTRSDLYLISTEGFRG